MSILDRANTVAKELLLGHTCSTCSNQHMSYRIEGDIRYFSYGCGEKHKKFPENQTCKKWKLMPNLDVFREECQRWKAAVVDEGSLEWGHGMMSGTPEGKNV